MLQITMQFQALPYGKTSVTGKNIDGSPTLWPTEFYWYGTRKSRGHIAASLFQKNGTSNFNRTDEAI